MLDSNYSGRIYECGVDEAGRGCISGPVVAAAVIIKPDFYHPKLNDSKKMSKKDRELLFDFIKENSVAYGISTVPVEIIDKINIREASMEAMHKAIKNMNREPDFIIVDGDYFRQYKNTTSNNMVGTRIIPHKCIIKGDSLYTSIAAASVLAKVHRDNYMKGLANEFPGYGWETNSGYGVKEHYEAIKKLGITPQHRKTFNLHI